MVYGRHTAYTVQRLKPNKCNCREYSYTTKRNVAERDLITELFSFLRYAAVCALLLQYNFKSMLGFETYYYICTPSNIHFGKMAI